jgi:F-type H+-transporting ATPase subunit delta
MDKTKTNAIIEGFWQYLKKKGKLNLLPEVLRGLSQKSDEMNGTAIVLSSSPLSKSQKDEVAKIIKSNFGSPMVEFEVDPDLIGGLKVSIGSEVLDLSVQNKLDYLTKSL